MTNPNLHPYIRAVLRFRLIVAAGLAVALCVPLLMMYRIVEFGPLPVLIARDQVSYLAQTQILVDSPKGPYLRTTQREVIAGVPTLPDAEAKPSLVPTVEPSSINEAANLFPILIMSDEIALRRSKMFGSIPGAVSAKAIYSFQGNNRFRPSALPVIQIQAIATTPPGALALAQGTFKAFNAWLGEQQWRAKIPPRQRIVLRQLNAPLGTVEVGGPSFGVPILAAIVVFFGFCGLAVVLDRLRPMRRVRASIPEDLVPGVPLAAVHTGGPDESVEPSSANGRRGVRAEPSPAPAEKTSQ